MSEGLNAGVYVFGIVAADPIVRRLISGANGGYLERLRLGEAVAEAVQQRIAAHASHVAKTLAPLAVRAVGLSFLVELARVGEFLDRASVWDVAPYRLRVAGPMPPYSFTD